MDDLVKRLEAATGALEAAERHFASAEQSYRAPNGEPATRMSKQTRQRLAAQYAQWQRDIAALAAAQATIHQLGENAAKAATEYAEEVGRLRRDCDGWRVQFEMSRESVAVARERIGKLEAEIGVLRGALERIGGVNGPYGYPFPEANPDYPAFAVMEARAALTEPSDG